MAFLWDLMWKLCVMYLGQALLKIVEIKPFGLGSRIRDMEAELRLNEG